MGQRSQEPLLTEFETMASQEAVRLLLHSREFPRCAVSRQLIGNTMAIHRAACLAELDNFRFGVGAGDRIRTCDPRFKRPLL